MSSILRDLVGSGFKWPFQFATELGGVDGITGVTGIEKINQSVYLVLATRKGEVFMNPLFGSDVPLILFDPIDAVFINRLKIETFDAIAKWVPQIQLVDVEVYTDDTDNNLARIVGTYYVRNTPVEGSFVFPFRIGSGQLL